jgi:UDP-N-acetylmuramate--alanine ligase
MVEKIKKIHFMGIGGSAVAGVAILAKKFGFEVSGCDLEQTTVYSTTLGNYNIPTFWGHNTQHLQGVDLLIVSPAVLYADPLPEEVVEAKEKGILITWQEFVGQYLQKDKIVLAIAGTHGKSTTTALLGLLLEGSNLDPIVEVGAIIPQWQSTMRFGNSDYFVCEADEFNNNFLNYSPGLIIINNLEMDHPEFFKDFVDFKESFKKYCKAGGDLRKIHMNILTDVQKFMGGSAPEDETGWKAVLCDRLETCPTGSIARGGGPGSPQVREMLYLQTVGLKTR